MINRNLGTAALLLALFGLVFGLAGCGADKTPDQASNPSDDALVVDANNFNELAELAQKLDIQMDELTEPEIHRGGGSEVATIFWPQRDITKEGLQTFRVDVGVEYEDNGRLEFRQGRTVLYSEPFQPADTITVAAIPQSVLDGIKPGRTVEWGVFFDKKRDSVTGKFKIVKSNKINRRLEKLETSKYFRRQDTMTREMMKTQVFQNTKLYSEALVQYLGILNHWPDVITPYKGIVETCRRLDLTETALYTVAAENVSGQGNLGRGTIRPGLQSPARQAGGRNALTTLTAPRIPETSAPPLQQRTSQGPKPLGTNLGVTPPEQSFEQPTNGNNNQPGEAGGTGAQAPGLEVLARRIQERADQAQKIVDNLMQGIDRVESANEDVETVQASLSELETNLADAQAAVDAANDAVEAATNEAEANAAAQAMADAQESLQQVQADHNDANNLLAEALEGQRVAQEALGMELSVAKEQAEQAAGLVEDARRESEVLAKAYEGHLNGETLGEHQIRNMQQEAFLKEQRFDARMDLKELELAAQQNADEVTQAESNLATIRAEIDAVIEGGSDPTSAQSELLTLREQELVQAEEGLHAIDIAIQDAWNRLKELGVEDPNLPEDAPGGG